MQHLTSAPSLRTLAVLLGAALLAGCMVLPRTTTRYNADCRTVERRVTLEAQQVGVIGGCRNNAECAGLLAVYGLVAAGSAVVSGSVAIVGNVVYWVENQVQCARGGEPDEIPAVPGVPASSPPAAPAGAASGAAA